MDDTNSTLYYGMKNPGVVKFNLNARKNERPALIAKVLKAKSEPGSDVIKEGVPRVINDAEGLALLHGASGSLSSRFMMHQLIISASTATFYSLSGNGAKGVTARSILAIGTPS